MRRNTPVPAGPRAPLGHRWLWWIGPPLILTYAWRAIPFRLPRKFGSNSHTAVAAIRAGGGWSAWERFAFRGIKDGIPFWLDG